MERVGQDEEVVQGDMLHGLPRAGSHFPSDSTTDFPSDQTAQKATKQLTPKSHLPYEAVSNHPAW